VHDILVLGRLLAKDGLGARRPFLVDRSDLGSAALGGRDPLALTGGEILVAACHGAAAGLRQDARTFGGPAAAGAVQIGHRLFGLFARQIGLDREPLRRRQLFEKRAAAFTRSS
jgi:hypothetical protein